MYLGHFGLDRPLFDDGIARDGAVFIGSAHRDTLTHASLALTSRDAVLVLTGPPGIGKTTMAAAAIGAAGSGSSRVVAAWLGTPALTPYEMLELLLVEFGFDPYQQTRVERLQTWRQFLIEMVSTDTRVFVAVEHADDLDQGVLKALAALTAADPNGCPGANLVLMGREGLPGRLRAPDLAELTQRVRMNRRLEGFDEPTVEAYLRHGVVSAGGEFDAVFGAGAVAALRSYTGGIPRVINQVSDTALGLAAARGSDRVTAGIVRQAAVDVCGLADPESVELHALTDPEPLPIRAPADPEPVEVHELADPQPVEIVDPAYPEPVEVHGVADPEPVDGGDASMPQHAPPPDDIPVLTESVEFDLDDDEVVAEPDDRASYGADFDELSADLVEAILAGDAAEPELPARDTGADGAGDLTPALPDRLRASA